MCLKIDVPMTQSIKNGQWPLIAYKVFTKFTPYELKSPYMKWFRYHAGKNYSGRKKPQCDREESKTKQVFFGMHVFLLKKDAEAFAGRFSRSTPVIIEVSCQLEHFIAAGTTSGNAPSAAFTMINIPSETLLVKEAI